MGIVFNIDKRESDETGTLAVGISEPQSRESIKRMMGGDDKAILELLLDLELLYQSRRKTNRLFIGGMTQITIFHIPYSKVFETLKKLDATRRLSFEGEKLLCDFYGEGEFAFITKAGVDGAVEISGRLKASGKEYNLEDCSFICGGHPLLYIHDHMLRCIITEVEWKDLRKAFTDPKSLSLRDLKDSYDDAEPLHPKFLGENCGDAEIGKDAEPIPLLILKERTGAFADLWMVYPGKSEKIRIACHDPASTLRDNKGLVRVRRDYTSEGSWEKDLLETDYTKKIVGTSHYYCSIESVAKSLTFLLEIGWQIEDCQGRKVCRQTDIELNITQQEIGALINGVVKYGEHDASITDVIGAFNRKERFIEIGVGLVGVLGNKIEHAGLLTAIEEGEVTPVGIQLKKNRFGCLADILESKENVRCDTSLMDLKNKLKTFEGIDRAEPTHAFTGALRPYQQQGVDWLNFLYTYGFHGLLADDMGLGKTVQVLAFLSRLNSDQPILIVLPTSLIFNWKREIERFLPSFNVVVHHGQDRIQDGSNLNKGVIILTSYTILRLDLHLFKPLHYACIILDEAQTIKNASTQTAKTLFQLSSRFRLSITGTPIENHPRELWSHFRFLMPDLLGEEQSFLAETTAAFADFRYLQKMRKKIKPFVLRRQKNEVATELPERIEQVVWVEMAPEQRLVYDEFIAKYKSNLFKKLEADGTAKHRMEILEAILRLRQICCHPTLAMQTEATSAKMEAVLEDVAMAIEEGRKVLLYSQFTSMLALLAENAKARGWKFAYLDGSTTNREKVVQQFQEDKDVSLFLISLKAGGIGLNLTAADYVFLYDPWWNDAIENQAIDRAHRIGRTDTVIAKRYITLESIEEKMMKLKAHKKSLINDLIEGDELASSSLSLDDLSFLLS